MSQSEHLCCLRSKFKCDDKPTGTESLIECGSKRITTIMRCSKIYEDDIHNQLEANELQQPQPKVMCHRNCASTYTSKHHLKRVCKRKSACESSPISPKKTRRSVSIAFSFQDQCIFCGNDCRLEKDMKNPLRWRQAYLFRETEGKGARKTMKLTLLDICKKRNDKWATQVAQRVESAISDLHAADARYHVDCRCAFTSSRSLQSASKGPASKPVDKALDCLISDMKSNITQVWTSVELFQSYVDYGGTVLSRKTLMSYISDHFGPKLLILSAPGIANIAVFRSKASDVLRLVNDEEDDLDAAISKISKQIKQDVSSMPVDKTSYSTFIDCESAMRNVSSTVMDLLTCLSSKLDRTLPAVFLASIITGSLSNHPTHLQVALGVLIRSSKELVNQLHAFGVTCSYDEVLRFKKSAALATTHDACLSGISNASGGLVQVVGDNFDADISSQNGKQSTHSLALLLTQTDQCSVQDMSQNIKRVKKTDMSKAIEYEVRIQRYNGPKKPEMPQSAACKSVLPLRVLIQQSLSRKKAANADFSFIHDVLYKDECPEFNGYNTAACREQKGNIMPKTTAVYLPLIDMTPSDPDTIMTALSRAQELTLKTGQEFVVFTCDLQLYRVALNVIWTYPDRFANVIMRLGGMHALMSFVGSIGTLMTETGLSEILGDVFGGVPKMLTGKKFPQNVRALRMLAEEVMRKVIESNELAGMDDLVTVLDTIAAKSNTSKVWIDVLIKPVFIMMSFIRAEREGDWPLHLAAFRQMMPYFFAAGHVHYARYGSQYLRSMETLPPNILKHFLNGEHVMRHVPGIWNGLWSDMYIETTFMRYGHGQGGIIGITLKPETLKTWALGLHICSSLESNLASMVDSEKEAQINDVHKEERKARIKADTMDRDGIRRRLELCIDPLDTDDHPDSVVNIVNGRVGPPSVNVHNTLAIGTSQMNDFESSLPTGFNGTIQKKVETMAVTKKHVHVNEAKLYDTNLIYSRVIGLQASTREVDITDILSHELSPTPTSMFTEDGEMRISKAKSMLKNELKVEVSSRLVRNTNTIIIDGSALLWVIKWPASGTVRDFAQNFSQYIGQKLQTGDVYVTFDRYYEYSTKSVTRRARTTEASRVHKLQPNTRLPPQKVVLTVTENKKQLINILCDELKEDTLFHQVHTQKHKLVITGQDKTPIEISNGGTVIYRRDLDTVQEEADTILVQQMLRVAKETTNGITVLSDDTDVFVLLLYHYLQAQLTTMVIMESPIKDRAVVDIGMTVDRHRNIITEVLPAHALSGCDTVAAYFGIGKGTALKAVRAGHSLTHIGNLDSDMTLVIAQATEFVAACYGQTKCATMSDARVNVWATKTGKGYTSTPKLSTLPPTKEAFTENVKRAHYQAHIWRSLAAESPVADIHTYGWTRDELNRTLVPIMVPETVSLAPASVMSLIRCGCASDPPCGSLRCGCRSANLPCTVFCACHDASCVNSHNRSPTQT